MNEIKPGEHFQRAIRRTLITRELNKTASLNDIKSTVRTQEAAHPATEAYHRLITELLPVDPHVDQLSEHLATELQQRCPQLEALVLLGSLGRGGALIRASADTLDKVDLDVGFILKQPISEEERATIQGQLDDVVKELKQQHSVLVQPFGEEFAICPGQRDGKYLEAIMPESPKALAKQIIQAYQAGYDESETVEEQVTLLLRRTYPLSTDQKIKTLVIDGLQQLHDSSPSIYDKFRNGLDKVFRRTNWFFMKYLDGSDNDNATSLDAKTQILYMHARDQIQDEQQHLWNEQIPAPERRSLFAKITNLLKGF